MPDSSVDLNSNFCGSNPLCSPQVLVFVSDGGDDCNQLDYPSISTSIDGIKAAGITVAAVGVGGNYSMPTLEQIATQPYSQYIHTLVPH